MVSERPTAFDPYLLASNSNPKSRLSMSSAESTWSKAEIEDLLARENFKYQNITLVRRFWI